VNARQWKQDTKSILVENELDRVKENVIKEVGVEMKIEFPMAKLKLFTKSKGADCCSII
jgi:hypothetical protein